MKLYVLIFILMFSNIVKSQVLEGEIMNEFNVPIINAEIINTRTSKHVHSNNDGFFMFINVEIGDTLKINHIRYSSKEFIVSILSRATIVLNFKPLTLNEIIIKPKLNALNVIANVNLQMNPVTSSQEVLKQVPGLFIGQHAGGGKAEQLFLRGFDIDHGTDINITTDGIPVNMVSHAHGQGYSDLHFIIPETISDIDFGKGPYYSNKGDFNTAGYVNFNTKTSFKENRVQFEAGQFNTLRTLGLFNLLNKPKDKAYIASEYIAIDGPFESSQNFNRINIFGKYTTYSSYFDRLSVSASYFKSIWDASGQIPQRAVDSGLINRFGAIDDTEGGNTSRSNIILNFDKSTSENSSIKNTIYYSLYDFELFSNFTFFLDDPINGDQIKQKEQRELFGMSSIYNHNFEFKKLSLLLNSGISLRFDNSIDNELSHTLNRQETLERYQFGDIKQSNTSVFLEGDLEVKKWIINGGVRLEYFDFDYNNHLSSDNTQSKSEAIINPKLNILYNYSDELQLYLKTGKGFHSNDTRTIIQQNAKELLPAAYGSDLGIIWKPNKKMLINTALWYLFSEQEFVYVGDAGIVENGGRTQRKGLDFSMRYQPFDWLYTNIDANYAHARAIDDKDYIPLAPSFTAIAGASVKLKSGFYGGFQFKHIMDRPANEDNSIVAEGYNIVDINLGYNWSKLSLGIQVQNLFNSEWNETQFATESRLQNEQQSIEEIHFTPGTPFFLKGIISYSF